MGFVVPSMALSTTVAYSIVIQSGRTEDGKEKKMMMTDDLVFVVARLTIRGTKIRALVVHTHTELNILSRRSYSVHFHGLPLIAHCLLPIFFLFYQLISRVPFCCLATCTGHDVCLVLKKKGGCVSKGSRTRGIIIQYKNNLTGTSSRHAIMNHNGLYIYLRGLYIKILREKKDG